MRSARVTAPVLLLARTVKLKSPPLVGVPLMRPLEARLNPDGSAPEATAHVIGLAPPASSVALYATLTLPLGRDVVRIDKDCSDVNARIVALQGSPQADMPSVHDVPSLENQLSPALTTGSTP